MSPLGSEAWPIFLVHTSKKKSDKLGAVHNLKFNLNYKQ